MIWINLGLFIGAVFVFLYKHLEVVALCHQIEDLCIERDMMDEEIEALKAKLSSSSSMGEQAPYKR